MRKIISALLVLATAALIVTGAILPKIVVRFQEEGRSDGVRYADMQSVRLDIGEELSLMGKLALMRVGEALTISDTNAAHTPEQIDAIARETLAMYQDTGLVAFFESGHVEIRPTMCVDPGNPGFYTIAWAVIISSDGSESNVVMMTIDDETGAVLSISYDTELTWFPEENQPEALVALEYLYFSGLGLADIPADTSRSDSALLDECVYSFYDEAYGQVKISLSAFESGFYIGFPE